MDVQYSPTFVAVNYTYNATNNKYDKDVGDVTNIYYFELKDGRNSSTIRNGSLYLMQALTVGNYYSWSYISSIVLAAPTMRSISLWLNSSRLLMASGLSLIDGSAGCATRRTGL